MQNISQKKKQNYFYKFKKILVLYKIETAQCLKFILKIIGKVMVNLLNWHIKCCALLSPRKLKLPR